MEGMPTAVLFTANPRETIRFYKTMLGFDVSTYRDGLLMQREDMTILFHPVRGRFPGHGMTVMLEPKDVRELHREYTGIGIPVMTDLKSRYREPLHFVVTDLNGCDLIFKGTKPSLTVHKGGLSNPVSRQTAAETRT
ncbi:MAG: VOC family protein [Pseudomonadota bacterium]